MAPVPSYSKKTLALVQSMAPEIAAAAARYGVPAEAIAGSLAQEQFDQTASSWNEMKARLSSFNADGFLAAAYAVGRATNPSNPEQGASDFILGRYNSDPNAITVGSDVLKKSTHPLLVDYGPAGMKFHNAIQEILKNPDDPAFKPYVKNLYSAGVALHKGSDKALMASAMAAYLRQGLEAYQSNMSINGDLKTGINSWHGLTPELQRALLVQYYKQGPTPERVKARQEIAAQNGVPYVPQIGVDGAGATYLANQGAITKALADAPADFASRWEAIPTSGSKNGSAPPIPFPGIPQLAERLATDR
ncbi:hypothetical protein JQ604_30720 [Bradyrhizobium jicamae]|uniref:hypothetical protein n=1 Tax=Bradyrhizobium jicamae TaxID=280332 RepID=UPI001BAE5289|nr:hypothetical protein [Bradyrhizobium jicamae]MBR0756574.1 hypothetical protein [Bradyrhizobium jicamae]